jgi:hypothetical protein
MGAWGPGGSGGGSGSNSSMTGVGVKLQRVGECRPAVSLLLRRKGEESKPVAEGTAADEDAAATTDATTASGEGAGAEAGGLSMLAGYGSGSDAEDD